jgi:hypothetical protein
MATDLDANDEYMTAAWIPPTDSRRRTVETNQQCRRIRHRWQRRSFRRQDRPDQLQYNFRHRKIRHTVLCHE